MTSRRRLGRYTGRSCTEARKVASFPHSCCTCIMRVLGIPVLSCVALVVAFVYLVYLYLVMIIYR